MDKRITDKLAIAAIIVTVAVAAIWLFFGGIEHIEDTNGRDDISLTTITDENIIKMDLGAKGFKKSTGSIAIGGLTVSSGVNFSADKFTGVYEVLYANFILPSDFTLDITGLTVHEGNFKMVIVNEDRIIATIDPAETNEIRIDDLTGYVSLRIAGESAAYSFHISSIDYDLYSHND